MIEKSCKVAGATVLLCFVMGEALDLASVRVEVAVDCDVKPRDTRATTLINKLPLFGIFGLVDRGTKIPEINKEFLLVSKKG